MRYDLSVADHEYRQLIHDVFPLYNEDSYNSRSLFGFWLLGLGRQYLYAIKYIVTSLFLFAIGVLSGTATHRSSMIVLGAVSWLVGSTPGFVLLFVEHRRHPRAVLLLTVATMFLWLVFFAIELYLAGRQH